MSVARQRLVETARDLFARHGIPNVGINQVIAAAKVARMSLYNHFASKDELVLAAFEAEAARRRQAIEAAQADAPTPRARVLALFDVAEALASEAGFRGCAFLNLAVETAAPESRGHALARRHKEWIRDNLAVQLRQAGAAAPEALAEQILVLWDGGIVGAYVRRTPAPLRAARTAALTLMSQAAAG